MVVIRDVLQSGSSEPGSSVSGLTGTTHTAFSMVSPSCSAYTVSHAHFGEQLTVQNIPHRHRTVSGTPSLSVTVPGVPTRQMAVFTGSSNMWDSDLGDAPGQSQDKTMDYPRHIITPADMGFKASDLVSLTRKPLPEVVSDRGSSVTKCGVSSALHNGQ